MSRTPFGSAPGERAYRLLLHAYPPAFRREYGHAMVELFSARAARLGERRGLGRLARWWAGVVADVAANASAEWLAVWRARRARLGADAPGRARLVELVVQDVRHAVRRLARTPGFTAISLVIVAVSVGANVAIFSAVNAVLLRPRPFERLDELVYVYQDSDDGRPSSNAFPAHRDMEAFTDVFAGAAAVMIEDSGAMLDEGGDAVPVAFEYATASYFPVVGLRPSRGRWFEAADDRPGGAPVAVLSHGAWRRRFGAAPDVLGHVVRLNGTPVTIVGVGPATYGGFVPGLTTDFWLSLSALGPVGGPFRARSLERREDHPFLTIARLRPGRSPADAQAAMSVLAARLSRDFPDTDAGRRITVRRADTVRLHPDVDGVLYPTAGLLSAVAALLLIVACANLANLLLARGSTRRREIAVRLAVGATRPRIVRALLFESLIVSAAGGLAGVLVATWLLGAIEAGTPPLPLSLTPALDIDGRVLLFACGLSIATGVAFGLAPALRASRPDLLPALKDAEPARATGGARRWRRLTLGRLLVVAQVAVSLALLVTGGLLVRSLVHTMRLDPGFDVDRLALVAVDVGQAGHRGAEGAALVAALRDRAAALPGVESAAFATRIPMTAFGARTTIEIDGYRPAEGTGAVDVPFALVSPGYFETMGVRLLHGRTLTHADGSGGEAVAVVSAAMARRFWGTTDVVDHRYRPQGSDGPGVRLVGVVADTPVGAAGEAPEPFLYRPIGQAGVTRAWLVVRTSATPAAFVEPLRRVVRAIDPLIPMLEAGTMADHAAAARAVPQAAAVLLVLVGGVAALLALLGVYSVVAFAVSRRRAEMGLRMALGARGGQVVGLVVGDMMTLVAAGTAVGLALAAVIAPALRGLLVGVRPLDPATFAGVAALVALVALVTSWLPARRAARADLASALRSE